MHQGADPPSPPLSRSERAPLSPGTAFLVLLGVLGVGFILGEAVAQRAPELQPVTFQSATGPARAAGSDNVGHPRPPSARRALARFNALNALRLRAYRTRDVTLLPRYLVPGSPLWGTGVREIRRMKRDGVTMRPRFDTKRLAVRLRTPAKIVVRQVVRQDPRFFSKSGRDITVPRAPQLVTVDWTLRRAGGRWLIARSWIQEVESLRKRASEGPEGENRRRDGRRD
jgi:hypothetical protein